MPVLVSDIADYQALLREEKIALLRLPACKRAAVALLMDLQKPSRQRRISAMLLMKLVVTIERNLSDPKDYIADFDALKLSLEMWNQLRVAGETTPPAERIDWDSAFAAEVEVRNRVLEASLYLVPLTRRRLVGNDSNNRHDLDAHGVVGLIKAMDNYDPSHGKSFENYAKTWIISVLLAYMKKDKSVYQTDSASRSISRYRRAIDELTAELDREPSDAEVAERLGVTIAQVEGYESMNVKTTSLDAAIDPSNETDTLHDIIAADQDDNSGDQLDRNAAQERVEMLFTDLSDLERAVLRLTLNVGYLPIPDAVPRTTSDAIARLFNRRLRQIMAACGVLRPKS